MKNNAPVFKWVTDYLISNGYTLQTSPEMIVESPWSMVMRFSTLKEDIYLKQTPPLLFLEPKIMRLLADKLHVNVPVVIAENTDLHCFLMKNAGQSLRGYLKKNVQPDLLCEAILQFTTIQRLTETQIESLLALGVSDWRLDKLPRLYDELIHQTEFLKADGMTDKELHLLHGLSSKVLEECELLSRYEIPQTLVQPDFNTNNMLFDPVLQKMTLIDLGEIAISHPFFSLHNFLYLATVHHGVKKDDRMYQKLLNACYLNWLDVTTKVRLSKMFFLVNKLREIYAALCQYRLMMSVDLQALKSFYINRPHQLAGHLRRYAGIKV